jgi:hypothetical protein
MTQQNPDETANELQNAVKSDDQAQLPAPPQLAGTQEDRAQSMTQSAATTLETATWTIAQHESWREKLRELQDDRDMEARVVAMFVLANDWDLAAAAAKKYDQYRNAVRAHVGLLPPSDKKKAN